jgi:hypothetical protein
MKKIIKTAVALAYAMPLAALASNIDANTFTKNNLGNFINGIATWFASIIFAISVLMILYAAFLFVTAGDNEEKVSKAKSIIGYGAIGIVVAMLAWAMRAVLVTFLT